MGKNITAIYREKRAAWQKIYDMPRAISLRVIIIFGESKPYLHVCGAL